MTIIENKTYGGERPLYASHDLEINNVTILEGESGLKECSNIVCRNSRFEGNYVLWRIFGLQMFNCTIAEPSRATLWYTYDIEMNDCTIDGPKSFRETERAVLNRCEFTNALETFWSCRDTKLVDCNIKGGDYLFLRSENIEIENMNLRGKYVFQYVKNVVIRNAVIDTKDAFWEAENVTVYDSKVTSEFLAWHSRNVKFVRCHISGGQPLCYAEGLVLEDCTFDPESDLAFEYSDVKATIKGGIKSIKNPRTGFITADSAEEVIIDENLIPGSDCVVTVKG